MVFKGFTLKMSFYKICNRAAQLIIYSFLDKPFGFGCVRMARRRTLAVSSNFGTFKHTLFRYKRALVIVSHSQDFMNNVCTNIIHLFQKKLVYYGVRIHCF